MPASIMHSVSEQRILARARFAHCRCAQERNGISAGWPIKPQRLTGALMLLRRNSYAGFSILLEPQHPLQQGFPAQHDAVLSLSLQHPFLQQDPLLSSFMHDFASFPQQDTPFLLAQQEAICFASPFCE